MAVGNAAGDFLNDGRSRQSIVVSHSQVNLVLLTLGEELFSTHALISTMRKPRHTLFFFSVLLAKKRLNTLRHNDLISEILAKQVSETGIKRCVYLRIIEMSVGIRQLRNIPTLYELYEYSGRFRHVSPLV
jgi:hypothetical protein